MDLYSANASQQDDERFDLQQKQFGLSILSMCLACLWIILVLQLPPIEQKTWSLGIRLIRQSKLTIGRGVDGEKCPKFTHPSHLIRQIPHLCLMTLR